MAHHLIRFAMEVCYARDVLGRAAAMPYLPIPTIPIA
jgi:hypothetical protein